MKAQQPIKISNLPLESSGTIFLNQSSIVQDISRHSVQFHFVDAKSKSVSKISDILTRTSGTFTVSGCVLWTAPAHAPADNSSKSVREGTLTDNSGSIKISVWEDHINQIKQEKFYTISNCKLRYFFGKRLATTKTTTITDAEEQDVSTVEKEVIMNVPVNTYPVCNKKECKKKISGNPGSNIVTCLTCNISMLLKNCFLQLNASFQLEKDDQIFNVTVFPKVLTKFLQEDVFSYSENTAPLIEKLLSINKVDFHLSPNGRLVTNIVDICMMFSILCDICVIFIMYTINIRTYINKSWVLIINLCIK